MTFSEAEIEKLWRAYLEHPTAYYVSKKCKVSQTTVGKYRDSRHWEERLQKIRDKACAIADDDDDDEEDDDHMAYQRATDVEVVHDIKMKIAESILKRLESSYYKPTVRDYDRLVRLEYYLRGSLDSRTKDSIGSWKWLEEVNEDQSKYSHSENY